MRDERSGRECHWRGGKRGDESGQDQETTTATSFLDQVVPTGKLVLAVDYPTSPAIIADFYSKARERGYIPYVSTRELDHLQINPGYQPD